MTVSPNKNRRWLLSGIVLLFLFLCLGGAAYLITNYPIWGSTAVDRVGVRVKIIATTLMNHPGR